jgi:hypothetical protein
MEVNTFYEKVVDSMVKKHPRLNREHALKDIKIIFTNDTAWSKVLQEMEEISKLYEIKEREVVNG